MLIGGRRTPDYRLLACMLLGVVVYLPTLRGEFVWDDLVFLGRWVGSTDTLSEILFPPPGVIGTQFYYRPITQGFATLLWAVFGSSDPTFWHAAIILVHVVTIGCVYALLREWWLAPAPGVPRDAERDRNREWAAVAGTAFYACWPANAESVAWISSRADTLLGPFLVGAIILHLRARDRGRRPVGAALLFFGSLLVKETGIVFLPMAVACTVLMPRGATAPDVPPERRAFDPSHFWATALWLPHVLAYFLYAWMRKYSMGSGTGLSEVAMAMLATLNPSRVIGAWGFYVQEALSLGEAPPFLQHPPQTPESTWFALIGIAAFAAACICLRWKKTWPIALAAAWFVLPLGPPLATVSKPLSQNAVTVHYLYIPNIALAALLGLAVTRLLARPLSRAARATLLAAGAILCVVSGVVTHDRYQPWMSARGLWERAVRDNPGACLPLDNLGVTYWDLNEYDLALSYLRQAAWTCKPQDSPERHGALIALSQFYLMSGDYERARIALREARALEGSTFMLSRGMELEATLSLMSHIPRNERGQDLEFSIPRSELRHALSTLEDAARVDPYGTEPRVFLGLLYMTVGERPRAVQYYRDAQRVASNDAVRRIATLQAEKLEAEIAAETDPMRRAYERGQIAELEGRRDDALAAYREALELAPTRGDLMLSIAELHATKGEIAEAIEKADAATKADERNPIAWLNLGVYRGRSGDTAGAEKAFARAVTLSPSSLKACVNHGRSLEVLGRHADAVTAYESCSRRVSEKEMDARPFLEREAARARAAVAQGEGSP